MNSIGVQRGSRILLHDVFLLWQGMTRWSSPKHDVECHYAAIKHSKYHIGCQTMGRVMTREDTASEAIHIKGGQLCIKAFWLTINSDDEYMFGIACKSIFVQQNNFFNDAIMGKAIFPLGTKQNNMTYVQYFTCHIMTN